MLQATQLTPTRCVPWKYTSPSGLSITVLCISGKHLHIMYCLHYAGCIPYSTSGPITTANWHQMGYHFLNQLQYICYFQRCNILPAVWRDSHFSWRTDSKLDQVQAGLKIVGLWKILLSLSSSLDSILNLHLQY